MYRDLTKGNITKTIIPFVLPMIAGNLLQQFYNIADTLIVGRFLGRDALCCGGICLYADDVSDLGASRAFDGGRGIIFHLPGKGM